MYNVYSYQVVLSNYKDNFIYAIHDIMDVTFDIV